MDLRTQSPGRLLRSARDGAEARVDFEHATLRVHPLAPHVLRVRLGRDGRFHPRRSWAVDSPAYSTPAEFDLMCGDGAVTIRTSALALSVASDGRIKLRDRGDDALILSDSTTDGGPSWDADGAASRWRFDMPEDVRYFGFGERTGLLDKRGRRLSCWNTDPFRMQSPATDEMYKANPFTLALNATGRSYGIFLNNTFRSAIDMRRIDDGVLTIEVTDGDLDLYIFNGPAPTDVIRRYTAIVGRTFLPPRWALGYQQARWTYTPQRRMLEIAREFRRRRIPADVICLDIDHMDRHRVFTWDREAFPDPEGMVRELHDLGFKVLPVIDPGVEYCPDGGYRVYDEGAARDCFIKHAGEAEARPMGYAWPGPCVLPDFARADVREWWGGYVCELADMGFDGVINDLNEPTLHDREYQDPDGLLIDPPPDAPQGANAEAATHAEVHNLYGHLESEAAFDGFASTGTGVRPLILTRSCFAGTQRHAGVWTGDNASAWEHLEMSLPQLMNLGLSGMTFAGADIGGFIGDCTPELLARWTQLGAFYPMARNHTAQDTVDQEPWARGPAVEDVCRRAIELRYRLLPYLYTVAEEASRTGLPFLRPLFLHYASDPDTHVLHDQALVGRDLLIAPVVRPGKRAREVYLPAGRWYDLRSQIAYDGPVWMLAEAALDQELPIFARGGSIIATAPVRQWVDEHPAEELTLHAFLDDAAHAAGELYEDDGVTYDYARGVLCRWGLLWDNASQQVYALAEGPFATPTGIVRAVIHERGRASRPADVTIRRG